MMKNLFAELKVNYKSLPLKKKLFYSYSVPIVCICMILCMGFYPFFSLYYKRQFRHIQTQSCVQAVNFISQYISNMYYISSLIENNAAVTAVISGKGLSDGRALDEQYREFWKLNTELQKISVTNSIYRIGIYMPDDLIYANNYYYFYPESTLEERPDFKDIKRKLNAGNKVFVSLSEIFSYSPVISMDEHIALLGTIQTADTGRPRKPLITKVEISVSEFEKILQKVNTTSRGIVYLHPTAKADLLQRPIRPYMGKCRKAGTSRLQKRGCGLCRIFPKAVSIICFPTTYRNTDGRCSALFLFQSTANRAASLYF